MLGLGLLGLHEIGSYGWRWLVVDLAWATVAGLGVAMEMGVSVPGDLSIVAFDNSKIAQLERISLTSVEHPSFFQGETATNILLEQINNPTLTLVTRKTIIPRIIQRSSVRAL